MTEGAGGCRRGVPEASKAELWGSERRGVTEPQRDSVEHSETKGAAGGRYIRPLIPVNTENRPLCSFKSFDHTKCK